MSSSLEVLRRERDEQANQAAVASAAAKFDFTAQPASLASEPGTVSGGYTIPKGRKYDIRRKRRHREKAAHLQGNMPVKKWNHFYGMYGNVPGSFMLGPGRTPLIMMPNPYLARSLMMSTLPAVEHDNRQLTDMDTGLRGEPSIISTSRQIEFRDGNIEQGVENFFEDGVNSVIDSVSSYIGAPIPTEMRRDLAREVSRRASVGVQNIILGLPRQPRAGASQGTRSNLDEQDSSSPLFD